MRYLVTGGTGFLGAEICRRLIEEGDEAVAYDVAPGAVLGWVLGEEEARRITVRGDVSDPLHVMRTAQQRQVDGIIHMAALLGVSVNADPPLGVRVNASGFVNALEAVRMLGLKRVVYASSIAVFRGYRSGDRIPNDAPYRPINIYGGTKILDEMLAKYYADAYGLETVGLRFSFMIGVARRHRSAETNAAPLGSGPVGGASPVPALWNTLLRELVQKPARGEASRVPCGDDVISWLSVEDAARAVVLAAKCAPTRSHAFNIGGDVRPIREAVAAVKALLPRADITVEAGTHGLAERVETTAIEEELGFRISWRMEDQIAALLKDEQTRTR